MAKFSAEFDTVEKTFSVFMDGKKMDNVKEFAAFPSFMDEDQFRVEVVQVESSEEDKMNRIIRTVATQDGVKEEDNIAERLGNLLLPK